MKTTKLFALIALLCVCITFTACSKDEETNNADIVGTWKMAAIKAGGVEIPVSMAGMTLSITFKSDGTWYGQSTGTPVSFGSGTYKLSGNNLSVKEQGITYNWTIAQLTAKQLEINWAEQSLSMIFDRK